VETYSVFIREDERKQEAPEVAIGSNTHQGLEDVFVIAILENVDSS
jgi:hypothetical protein